MSKLTEEDKKVSTLLHDIQKNPSLAQEKDRPSNLNSPSKITKAPISPQEIKRGSRLLPEKKRSSTSTSEPQKDSNLSKENNHNSIQEPKDISKRPPQKRKTQKKLWKQDLLGCFGNYSLCIITCCAFPLAIGKNAEFVGENPTLWVIAITTSPCVAGPLLRVLIRQKQVIEWNFHKEIT